MRHHRDRLEVLHRVVGDLLVERRIDRHRGARRHQQRVAVGRGLGDRVDPDLLAGAGPVLDHERLADPLLPYLRAMRASRSVEPAGVNGTITVTFLVG